MSTGGKKGLTLSLSDKVVNTRNEVAKELGRRNLSEYTLYELMQHKAEVLSGKGKETHKINPQKIY